MPRADKTLYCWVNSSNVPSPRIHACKPRTVRWTDGSSEVRQGPACGARIDWCAIEYERGHGPASLGCYGDPCRRCFPRKKGA